MSVAIASALLTNPAQATIYTFAASCSDCTGPSGTPLVTATLILAGDTPGQSSDASNFVSFSYDGSNRAPAFTILSGAYPLTFSALFLDETTQSADVYIRGIDGSTLNGWEFTTAADGTFNLSGFGSGISGGAGGVDQGTDAIWTNEALSSVPEAPSFTLVGVGLIAAIAATRRRLTRRA
jgi:hypothetical protein